MDGFLVFCQVLRSTLSMMVYIQDFNKTCAYSDFFEIMPTWQAVALIGEEILI